MRSDSLHVTLCFLSYHPEKAIPRIADVITSFAPRPVVLSFDPRPSAIPKGRPRLYAIGGESESASALQEELSQALVAKRFYRPEKRGFWPHVTVARVRSERLPPGPGQRRGKGRPRRVERPPAPLPSALTEPFRAVRIALYRSDLKPQGAEYTSLAGVDLPSP
jgi:2'-5' RNA ligase